MHYFPLHTSFPASIEEPPAWDIESIRHWSAENHIDWLDDLMPCIVDMPTGESEPTRTSWGLMVMMKGTQETFCEVFATMFDSLSKEERNQENDFQYKTYAIYAALTGVEGDAKYGWLEEQFYTASSLLGNEAYKKYPDLRTILLDGISQCRDLVVLSRVMEEPSVQQLVQSHLEERIQTKHAVLVSPAMHEYYLTGMARETDGLLSRTSQLLSAMVWRDAVAFECAARAIPNWVQFTLDALPEAQLTVMTGAGDMPADGVVPTEGSKSGESIISCIAKHGTPEIWEFAYRETPESFHQPIKGDEQSRTAVELAFVYNPQLCEYFSEVAGVSTGGSKASQHLFDELFNDSEAIIKIVFDALMISEVSVLRSLMISFDSPSFKETLVAKELCEPLLYQVVSLSEKITNPFELVLICEVVQELASILSMVECETLKLTPEQSAKCLNLVQELSLRIRVQINLSGHEPILTIEEILIQSATEWFKLLLRSQGETITSYLIRAESHKVLADYFDSKVTSGDEALLNAWLGSTMDACFNGDFSKKQRTQLLQAINRSIFLRNPEVSEEQQEALQEDWLITLTRFFQSSWLTEKSGSEQIEVIMQLKNSMGEVIGCVTFEEAPPEYFQTYMASVQSLLQGWVDRHRTAEGEHSEAVEDFIEQESLIKKLSAPRKSGFDLCFMFSAPEKISYVVYEKLLDYVCDDGFTLRFHLLVNGANKASVPDMFLDPTWCPSEEMIRVIHEKAPDSVWFLVLAFVIGQRAGKQTLNFQAVVSEVQSRKDSVSADDGAHIIRLFTAVGQHFLSRTHKNELLKIAGALADVPSIAERKEISPFNQLYFLMTYLDLVPAEYLSIQHLLQAAKFTDFEASVRVSKDGFQSFLFLLKSKITTEALLDEQQRNDGVFLLDRMVHEYQYHYPECDFVRDKSLAAQNLLGCFKDGDSGKAQSAEHLDCSKTIKQFYIMISDTGHLLALYEQCYEELAKAGKVSISKRIGRLSPFCIKNQTKKVVKLQKSFQLLFQYLSWGEISEADFVQYGMNLLEDCMLCYKPKYEESQYVLFCQKLMVLLQDCGQLKEGKVSAADESHTDSSVKNIRQVLCENLSYYHVLQEVSEDCFLDRLPRTYLANISKVVGQSDICIEVQAGIISPLIGLMTLVEFRMHEVYFVEDETDRFQRIMMSKECQTIVCMMKTALENLIGTVDPHYQESHEASEQDIFAEYGGARAVLDNILPSGERDCFKAWLSHFLMPYMHALNQRVPHDRVCITASDESSSETASDETSSETTSDESSSEMMGWLPLFSALSSLVVVESRAAAPSSPGEAASSEVEAIEQPVLMASRTIPLVFLTEVKCINVATFAKCIFELQDADVEATLSQLEVNKRAKRKAAELLAKLKKCTGFYDSECLFKKDYFRMVVRLIRSFRYSEEAMAHFFIVSDKTLDGIRKIFNVLLSPTYSALMEYLEGSTAFESPEATCGWPQLFRLSDGWIDLPTLEGTGTKDKFFKDNTEYLVDTMAALDEAFQSTEFPLPRLHIYESQEKEFRVVPDGEAPAYTFSSSLMIFQITNFIEWSMDVMKCSPHRVEMTFSDMKSLKLRCVSTVHPYTTLSSWFDYVTKKELLPIAACTKISDEFHLLLLQALMATKNRYSSPECIELIEPLIIQYGRQLLKIKPHLKPDVYVVCQTLGFLDSDAEQPLKLQLVRSGVSQYLSLFEMTQSLILQALSSHSAQARAAHLNGALHIVSQQFELIACIEERNEMLASGRLAGVYDEKLLESMRFFETDPSDAFETTMSLLRTIVLFKRFPAASTLHGSLAFLEKIMSDAFKDKIVDRRLDFPYVLCCLMSLAQQIDVPSLEPAVTLSGLSGGGAASDSSSPLPVSTLSRVAEEVCEGDAAAGEGGYQPAHKLARTALPKSEVVEAARLTAGFPIRRTRPK